MLPSGLRSTLLGSVLVLLAATGCAGMGGESVALRTTPIPLQRSQDVGTVSVALQADDRRPGDRSEIGKSTWTLFKIKHSGITSSAPLSSELVRILEQDLQAAGYPVELVSPTSDADTPVLELGIDQFEFEMWSYFWPYIMIDGNIALSSEIRASPRARLLAARRFAAPGKATCWFGGCGGKIEDAIEKSLRSIRLELNLWFNSEDFRSVWDQRVGDRADAP